MILAFDVCYYEEEDYARVGVAAFAEWLDSTPYGTYTHVVRGLAPYEPGAFYKRELPCLMAAIEAHQLKADVYVVDGYVDLGGERKGLGRHLYEALGSAAKVIGVAKKVFHESDAERVLRGGSANPLYVTAAGMNPKDAAELVKAMHGPYRIPTLLTLTDHLSRGWLSPDGHLPGSRPTTSTTRSSAQLHDGVGPEDDR